MEQIKVEVCLGKVYDVVIQGDGSWTFTWGNKYNPKQFTYPKEDVRIHLDNGSWIVIECCEEVSKENKFTQAFNMWQDDFCNNPQAYEIASDTAMRHLKEKLDGEEPSYGAVAAQIFQQYLTTLENQNV